MKILNDLGHVLHFLEGDSSRDVLDLIPIPVYCKNTEGVYLWRNQCAIEIMSQQGFEAEKEKSDITGKTDFDLFEKRTANQFFINDQQVIRDKATEFKPIIEKIALPNGLFGENISVKKVTTTSCGRVSGIIGCSITTNLYEPSNKDLFEENYCYLKKLIIQFMRSGDPRLLNQIDQAFFESNLFQQNTLGNLRLLLTLSRRELEVFLMTIRGFSNKEVGELLNISNRTVESYLLNLKQKLGISNKSEFYDFIWGILS